MKKERNVGVLVVIQVIDFEIQCVKEGWHCMFDVIPDVEQCKETETGQCN